MNDRDSTKIRVKNALVERLKKANALVPHLSETALLNLVVEQALDQVERTQPAPGPLPIVEELRRLRGLGSTDALRQVVDSRHELGAVVREEVGNAVREALDLLDLGAKYQRLREAAHPSPAPRKHGVK